ncbi:MAG: transglutaminase domain-containing protein [Desulfovibrio sp.]|uniref:transglutaminase domain-containing protein n=1 Tax=Desulfovibrio sp. 7SRBS1 TaxID=3378064 RepID=UPI003B3D5FE3
MRGLLTWLGVAAICLGWSQVHAQTLELDGDMRSNVAFELKQDITLPGGAKRVSASFVVPDEFVSPTFVQKIHDYKLLFSPPPNRKDSSTDKRGNRIITATWNNPPDKVDMTVTFEVDNQTLLHRLETTAGFPVFSVPPSVAPYLEPSAQVQSDDSRIKALAARLTAGADTEYDAVQKIVGHVVDHLRYVSLPKKYDAVYSMGSGKGNCQNFSHLSAALLRASGIPARIVNGYTLARPYSVQEGRSIYTFKSADGRHSWIEVWFPDLGWVPFDAQKTSFFVANRFIRVEVGLDNKETINDGRIRFTRASANAPRPQFKSGLGGDFTDDAVNLAARKGSLVTDKLLLFPGVEAVAAVQATTPPVAEPSIAKTDVAKTSAPKPAKSAPVSPKAVEPKPAVPEVAPEKPVVPKAEPKPVEPKPAAPEPVAPEPVTSEPAVPEKAAPKFVVPKAPAPEFVGGKSSAPKAVPGETSAPDKPVVDNDVAKVAPMPEPSQVSQDDAPAPSPAPGKTVAPSVPGKPLWPNRPAPARFVGPVEFGNLDFPENTDFTDYGTMTQVGEDQFEVTRNFLVESAEYVTTRATQYAQVFRVKHPMALEKVALALHRYGGGGMLWLDLYENADGAPGKLLAASEMTDVVAMSMAPGYRWQNFDFGRERPVLRPGYYWLGLGFAGDPIVNWFYTFGKPEGPLWGTRSRDVFDEEWSSSLGYEFNYRVQGENLPPDHAQAR